MRAPAAVVALAAAALAAACADNRTHLDADAGAAPPNEFSCLPNLDGRITADELRPATGVEVAYLIGEDRDVDLSGPDWDWTEDAAGETKRSFAAAPLAGHWFAADFPGGQLTAPLDTAGDSLAIYAQDDDALRLLGIASATPDQTLLAYDPPVALYRFPLADGDAWTESGQVGGTLNGLPYRSEDTYEIEVDGTGALALPHLAFTQAHRVRTLVTIVPAAGGVTVTRRQVSFLFECFGEVARATSRDGETAEDFTFAAEVRRFSL
jgi:hypothetical protein